MTNYAPTLLYTATILLIHTSLLKVKWQQCTLVFRRQEFELRPDHQLP